MEILKIFCFKYFISIIFNFVLSDVQSTMPSRLWYHVFSYMVIKVSEEYPKYYYQIL
jgi:hypothetical protein